MDPKTARLQQPMYWSLLVFQKMLNDANDALSEADYELFIRDILDTCDEELDELTQDRRLARKRRARANR